MTRPASARSYGRLGMLTQVRGDYEEAADRYQRSLGISERIGDQAKTAASYGQLGILEKERGGSITAAVTWHVRALAIRLHLGVPEALIDLRRLAAYRLESGAGSFTSVLTQAANDTSLVQTITSLLDQLDKADGEDSMTGGLSEVMGH